MPVKHVFEDVLLARRYIQNSDKPVTLHEEDREYLERLLASYVYDTYHQGGYESVSYDMIMKTITIERLTNFLAPSKLRIGNDVDIKSMALKMLGSSGSEQLIKYQMFHQQEDGLFTCFIVMVNVQTGQINNL